MLSRLDVLCEGFDKLVGGGQIAEVARITWSKKKKREGDGYFHEKRLPKYVQAPLTRTAATAGLTERQGDERLVFVLCWELDVVHDFADRIGGSGGLLRFGHRTPCFAKKGKCAGWESIGENTIHGQVRANIPRVHFEYRHVCGLLEGERRRGRGEQTRSFRFLAAKGFPPRPLQTPATRLSLFKLQEGPHPDPNPIQKEAPFG
jgi:hypothetical protein